MKLAKLIACTALLCSSVDAFGAVIYSSGPQTTQDSGFDTGLKSNSAFSGYRVYDDLSLTIGTTITGVQNWQIGTLQNDNIGNFIFTLFEGTLGSIGASVYSETFEVGDYSDEVDTGLTAAVTSGNAQNATFYKVDFQLDEAFVLTQEDYVFSMRGTGWGTFSLFWANTGSGNGFRQNSTNFAGDTPLEFVGIAAVPEPSVMALFGLGLVGLGFARRRRA